MGASKSTLFSIEHNRLADMAKALAHPARIAILEQIIKEGSCVCGDLVNKLPLSQATVSQHLKAMKDAEIIRGEVDGPYRCYCINMSRCQELMMNLKNLFINKKCC